ncbi:uncharacterized protein Triagg1_3901 [Trichoderma aggressivum f. europaeum]|uniref:Ankyrin repeat protein n=1 Tax=Trichoderma aggressivum f. europaeum TaxID=173218 RepID=A0AAE1M697_9HYPO|nr:hypothetical protein Triagg1_3901 [Trichoderma aggressivum f. europaeum]
MSLSARERSLIDAANCGDAERVEAILKEGVNPSVKDERGSTLLHNMCKEGNIAISRLFLEYRADQDTKDESNSTPLHYAAQGGHSKIVQLLLHFWADPLAKDNRGWIPLHYAVTEDIALLLGGGEYAEITTEEAEVGRAPQEPVFPIKINGNDLNQSIKPAEDASETNYILIQTRGAISDPEKDILKRMNVEFYDCICENTYLCRYEPDDLEILRRKRFIVYVDVYRQEFKIDAALKMEAINVGQIIEVVLLFHDSSKLDVENKRAHIVKKINIDHQEDGIRFFKQKAHLTIPRTCLSALASIDEVRKIEKLGKVVLRNDQAHSIMEAGI